MRSTLTTSVVVAALLAGGAGPAAARPAVSADQVDAANHAHTMRGLAAYNHTDTGSAAAPVRIVRYTRAAADDGGFSWADAGIGAGLAAALLLSAAGVSTIRRPHAPATR